MVGDSKDCTVTTAPLPRPPLAARPKPVTARIVMVIALVVVMVLVMAAVGALVMQCGGRTRCGWRCSNDMEGVRQNKIQKNKRESKEGREEGRKGGRKEGGGGTSGQQRSYPTPRLLLRVAEEVEGGG
jgi:uncharacterized membrane protein YgcG